MLTFIGISPFRLMGDQTVHEDSNNVTRLIQAFIKIFDKPNIQTENSWYGSSTLTSTHTDHSQNYLEH